MTNDMFINEDKSKVMLFNTARDFDFMPKLTINQESCLEVVEQFKLLGVILRSDLKWHDNSNYICSRGYARLWMIRRLKSLGADLDDMLDVYCKQIRSILELAVPVWQPNLSNHEVKQIERVQKTAFHVILGQDYHDYPTALATLGVQSLSERRVTLCLNFARKALKHEKYQSWFYPATGKIIS